MWRAIDNACIVIAALSVVALWIGWRVILPVIGGLWLFGLL